MNSATLFIENGNRVKSAYGLTDIILTNNCLVDKLSADPSGRSPALPYPPASKTKCNKYCLYIKQNTKLQSRIPVIIKIDNTKKFFFSCKGGFLCLTGAY